jgi:hypothetical protein
MFGKIERLTAPPASVIKLRSARATARGDATVQIAIRARSGQAINAPVAS